MRITGHGTYAPTADATPSLYTLRQYAERIRKELWAIHEAYRQTGDEKLLPRQAQLSIEYERALHQVRKNMQGRTDGPFGS